MNLEKIRKDLENADVVWIGEVHGSIENYAAHKELILFLLDAGFHAIFWEMPDDLSVHFEDGRFSSHGRLFLRWLQELKSRTSFKLCLFDKRYTLPPHCGAQEKENRLAQELIDNLDTKSIIVTGNFHSQLRDQYVQGERIVPCAGIVKKQLRTYNFLLIGYAYNGGEIFNFQRQSIPADYFAFNRGERGDVYENTNTLRDERYWINVGKASPVL